MKLGSHLVWCALLLGTEAFSMTVIPIELVKGNPIAAAKINGVPVSLLIDSGGGIVVIDPDISKRLGARSGSTRESTDVYGRNTPQALFTLNTLELGGSTYFNVAAGEAGEYVAQAPGDGIVGREFLNQFIVAYDYAARKITLFKPEERDEADRQCRGAGVPILPDPDGIIVTLAQTDHQPMRMLWDTGATHSFVKKTFADTHKLPIAEPFYSSQRFLLGSDDFGPLQFVVLDAKAPPNTDGYVGYNFFAAHVVCIDARNHNVKIHKSRQGSSVP